MDSYSIVDRSEKGLAPPSGGVTTQARRANLPEPGRGLSIVDSARRDLEATLQLLADRAQYITGAAGAAIALRDGDRVLCRASSGSAAPDLGSCLDLSTGLSGESVRTRTPLRCDDAANDPRVDRESCRRLGIASLAVMPILRDGEAIGVFEIFSGKPHAFQERDLSALERLREMVNIALDQAAPDHVKPAPFAVHGAKVKVLAAAVGAGFGAEASVVSDHYDGVAQKSGFITGLPGTPAHLQENSPPLDRIRTCKNCGFPVSEGRAFCLDCEAKGVPASDSGFLTGVDYHPSQPGIKSWILSNRYVIGMILISAATIAFALLR
jgi:hypothetical protein